jgi:hypothetical protein
LGAGQGDDAFDIGDGEEWVRAGPGEGCDGQCERLVEADGEGEGGGLGGVGLEAEKGGGGAAVMTTTVAGRQRKATFQFRGPRESQRWTPDWPDCQRLRRRRMGVRRRMAGMRRAVS